jgi:hypothetical protein
LKVEDALLYLDQVSLLPIPIPSPPCSSSVTLILNSVKVKIEFSDQPKIYNEFLEIMKNFKAQSYLSPAPPSAPHLISLE